MKRWRILKFKFSYYRFNGGRGASVRYRLPAPRQEDLTKFALDWMPGDRRVKLDLVIARPPFPGSEQPSRRLGEEDGVWKWIC
ncbi:hypothetical protein NPIL_136311 [Nephila pilipes]|uniref:Uncharacterized protein n=1 Tax=Nephila pilipes TaxID=299642 RepID=A0A8X6U921_NEPPI|nr:hypothetical protein NPIL_136311 [Nephila pilipes]